MSNVTNRNLPDEKLLQSTYTTTNALTSNIQGWPRMTTVAENTLVENILSDAVWRIDALDHQREGMPAKIVRNLGSAGPILNCRSGSTSVTDSNDPKFLDHTGTNYVYLPGVAGNILSVPDEAALDITGDIDLRAYVALDDWTPSTQQHLISKFDNNTTAERAYELRITVNGEISIDFAINGGNNSNIRTSTDAITIEDGAPLWVRATLDVDNGASGHDTNFYTSTDGTTWTQLGTTVTNAGVISIRDSGTEDVVIGRRSTGATGIATGKFYRAQILDGIDGTTVLDVDTSVITSGSATSFTAVTGQTVTINRSTSGRKTVTVTTPVWLFGTDDQILVPNSTTGSKAVDFGPNDSFTALVIMRRWATQPSNRGILSKYQGPGGLTGPGYIIFSGSTSQAIGFSYEDVRDNGVTNSNTFVNGDVSLVGGLVNRKNNFSRIFGTEPVFDLTTTRVNDRAEIVNTGILTVGARGNNNNYYDMEFIAAGIWRRALSRQEVNAITTYYLNRWK